MGLSSNVLWHQTDVKGFYAILESKKLLYSYSIETIIADTVEHVEAFPMISLSDLPFSELDFYINCENYGENSKFKTYGGYIIGFKRCWGISNNFSPVWYCESYNEALLRIINEWDKKHGDELLYYLIGNVKNTEGKLSKANADLYRFQNEREYRRLLGHGVVKTLSATEYQKYKDAHGKSSIVLPKKGVSFEYDDIIYLIVPDDDAKKTFYSLPEEKRPKVPVFTCEEVNQNFIGIRHHRIKFAVDGYKSETEKTEEEVVPVDITSFDNSTTSRQTDTITGNEAKKNIFANINDMVAVPEVFKKVRELHEAIGKIINPLDSYIKMMDGFNDKLPINDLTDSKLAKINKDITLDGQ